MDKKSCPKKHLSQKISMLVFNQERGSGYANACSFIQVSQKHQASLSRNQTMKTELSAAKAARNK